MFMIISILSSLMFVSDNREFFQVTKEQMDKGATWNFVGAQIANPNAESITIRSWDGDRYIFWRLHK